MRARTLLHRSGAWLLLLGIASGPAAGAESGFTSAADAGLVTHDPPMLGPTITVDALKAGAPLKIIGYGDTRFTYPSNTVDTNPRMRKFLVDRIADEAADALFETGDLPLIGSAPWDWANFRKETAPWRAEGLRVFPTIGNHEVADDFYVGIRNYLAAFPSLKGCRYYSVLLGNVYLISIDEFTPITRGARQRDWLVSQLEHLPPQVDFVFLMDHMPLVDDLQSQVAVSLPERQETELRSILEAEKLKTRALFVVLSGHIHNYERFQRGAITYIVTGGGGAKPYPVLVRGPEDLFRDPRFPVFHYVVFLLHGTHLEATMYRVADPQAAAPKMEAADHFTLDAPPPR
ncbi:MAG TPA: metallophosphoesterase [Acidobacteriaceae bacterium]